MDGVTILRSYEVLTGWAPGWSWIGLASAILALLALSLCIFVAHRRPTQWKVWLTLGIMAIILIAATVVSFMNAVPIYEIQYDAYLSGTVDMTLFTRKYEILEQDGLLFMLRATNPIT